VSESPVNVQWTTGKRDYVFLEQDVVPDKLKMNDMVGPVGGATLGMVTFWQTSYPADPSGRIGHVVVQVSGTAALGTQVTFSIYKTLPYAASLLVKHDKWRNSFVVRNNKERRAIVSGYLTGGRRKGVDRRRPKYDLRTTLVDPVLANYPWSFGGNLDITDVWKEYCLKPPKPKSPVCSVQFDQNVPEKYVKKIRYVFNEIAKAVNESETWPKRLVALQNIRMSVTDWYHEEGGL
jgi:hypothetical protein